MYSITSATTKSEPVAQIRSLGVALANARSTAEATFSATSVVIPHFENSATSWAGSRARGWLERVAITILGRDASSATIPATSLSEGNPENKNHPLKIKILLKSFSQPLY